MVTVPSVDTETQTTDVITAFAGLGGSVGYGVATFKPGYLSDELRCFVRDSSLFSENYVTNKLIIQKLLQVWNYILFLYWLKLKISTVNTCKVLLKTIRCCY